MRGAARPGAWTEGRARWRRGAASWGARVLVLQIRERDPEDLVVHALVHPLALARAGVRELACNHTTHTQREQRGVKRLVFYEFR